MNQVFAFECRIVGNPPDWKTVVNARTAGQAKVDYWRDVRDAYPDIPYTSVRARKLGAPRATPRLTSCVECRGVDFTAGERVQVEDALGVIVDGSWGANFSVLFDEDSRYRGARLTVHPSDIQKIVSL